MSQCVCGENILLKAMNTSSLARHPRRPTAKAVRDVLWAMLLSAAGVGVPDRARGHWAGGHAPCGTGGCSGVSRRRHHTTDGVCGVQRKWVPHPSPVPSSYSTPPRSRALWCWLNAMPCPFSDPLGHRRDCFRLRLCASTFPKPRMIYLTPKPLVSGWQ